MSTTTLHRAQRIAWLVAAAVVAAGFAVAGSSVGQVRTSALVACAEKIEAPKPGGLAGLRRFGPAEGETLSRIDDRCRS